MTTPADPTRLTAVPAAAGGADGTAPVPAGAGRPAAPVFGPPAAAGEVCTLGPYRVVRELGRGAMGAVYAALDTRLGRRLALKVMLPHVAADPAARERFLREARAAARVAHEHVVTVYEADEREGVPYIAMQFLDGRPLDEYLKTATPTVAQAVRVAREAALGLAAAHATALVHRDVKPGNLWLEAPRGRVKVLDFGLARPVDADAELTKQGVVVGTPAYMSPEQARGEKVDHRADLFGLGAVLYRLCAGRLPFEGATTMAVLIALGTEEPPPVRALNPAVPESLAALIHELLAKTPADRPPSADEVARRLRAIAQELAVPAGPPTAAVPVAAAPDANPFEEFDAAEPAPARAERAVAWRRAALGAAVLLAFATLGVIDAVKNRGGSKADPPTAGAGQTPPGVGAAPADPDRAAAKWALEIGGFVWVSGSEGKVTTVDALPKDRFTLTGAYLTRTQVTDDGLKSLAGARGLVTLNLSKTPVTNAGLAHLKDLPVLRTLDLDETKVTDKGLVTFKDFRALKELHLNGTRVTNTGLEYLKDCTGLALLGVGRTGVTGDGLKHLANLDALTHLGLGHNMLTSDDLATLVKNHRGLTTLWLDETRLTDDGLKHLQALTNLCDLDVRKTDVTATGLAAFHAAVPGCRIEHDGGTLGPKN